MGIIAVIENNDRLYDEYCRTGKPIIVNEHPLDKPEERQYFNGLLMTQYEGETISTVPSCICKKYTGGIYKHRICEDCGEKVLADIERPIKFAAWLATPKGIDALINPILFYQLHKRFQFNTFNLFEWVINPKYVVQGKKDPKLKAIEISGIPRGLNAFCRNPHKVLDMLFRKPFLRSNVSVSAAQALKAYFIHHIESGNFFCKHIPLQSKAMFITENTAYGKYASDLMLQGVEPAIILSNLDNSTLSKNQQLRESRTVKALLKLVSYHIDDFDKSWAHSETGAVRNHIYSSRTDWTGRAVIGSIQDPFAELDELYLPWSMGLVLFEVHVTNKLLARGYSMKDATMMIESSISNNLSLFKPLLERILDELIDECKTTPKYGFPCTWLRNPSLTRGSSQCMRITKIKKDANDKIVEWHLLAYKAPNADLKYIGVRFYAK